MLANRNCYGCQHVAAVLYVTSPRRIYQRNFIGHIHERYVPSRYAVLAVEGSAVRQRAASAWRAPGRFKSQSFALIYILSNIMHASANRFFFS